MHTRLDHVLQMAAHGGSLDVRAEDSASITFASESVFRRTAGRPRKYACSWFAANKRIYISSETLEKLRAVKARSGLGSDDAVVLHLIQRHEHLCTIERYV